MDAFAADQRWTARQQHREEMHELDRVRALLREAVALLEDRDAVDFGDRADALAEAAKARLATRRDRRQAT